MASRRLFDGAQTELGILPIVGASGAIEARTASFAGTGAFSAQAGSIEARTASFDGTATFSAVPDSGGIEARTASFAGSGAVSAFSGTPTPARYWRVFVREVGGDISCAELQMRTSYGGSNVATGGTASASSVFSGSFPASNAFDGNNSTIWASISQAGGWIKYDFGSGNDKDIVEITWRARNDSNVEQNPSDFAVQYSSDDTNWTDAWSVHHTAFTSLGEVRTFTRPASGLGATQYWAVRVGRGTGLQTMGGSEMDLAESFGGSDITGSRTAARALSEFDGSSGVTNLFDNNTGTNYSSLANEAADSVYIALEWSTARLIEEVKWTARQTTGGFSQHLHSPTRGWVERSPDNINYITYWTFNNTTTWTPLEQRTFQNGVDARTASFAGTAAFSAVTGPSITGSFAGTGAFTVASGSLVARTASFAGTAAFSAVTGSSVTGSFAGTGAFSATSGYVDARTASFAGAATFSAVTGSSVTGSFEGTGAFSATSGYVDARTASFAGAAAFSAAGGSSITASFAGTGAFSATSGYVDARTASFAGTGTFTVSSAALIARTASFAGAGTLSATSAAVAARTGSFAGTAAFSAASGSASARTASFAGAGAFSAASGARAASTGSFAGAAAFSAVGAAPAGSSGLFAGVGAFTVTSGSFVRPIGGPASGTFTPQSVITTVRNIVQDTVAPYRYSDIEMLSHVNMALKTISVYRPDIFSYITVLPTVADSVLQTLNSEAIRLVEVSSVYGGNAVTEVNRETMDQMYPTWVSDPAGIPVNFVRHPRNPTSYFLYPRPIEGISVAVEYIRAPVDYDIGEAIDITPDMFAVIVSITVHMLEGGDTEPNNAERTKLFRDLALDAMTASLNNRAVPDTETAAVKKLR